MTKDHITSKAIDPFFQKIEKLTKVQRILICFLTILLLAGSFVYFSYLPKFKEIDKLSKEYDGLAKQLIIAKNEAKDLEKYRNEMKQAEDQYRIVMKALPEKKEIPSLLAAISQSGQDAGLEFLLFEPKAEVQKDFYTEIPVSIQVKGNYHNVALFFDKISRLSRIVNINDIKIALPKENEDKLSTSCTAVTYKFVDAPPQKAQNSKTKPGKTGKSKK
ncbi:MAG TPA: type 4a pilus biogenesis protein PilO [Desulfobacterales bacterium]|nr:type 4a pilus biogenesis protein PilO [Desulfobacterales bacterium]